MGSEAQWRRSTDVHWATCGIYAVAAASAAAKRNFFIGAASSVASFLRSDAAVAEALVWEGGTLLLVQQGTEWQELALY